MASTAGVTIATDHCSPDASYCKDVVPGNSAGVPVIAFGAMAAVAGALLVATSHDKSNSSHHASVASAGIEPERRLAVASTPSQSKVTP